MCEMSKNIVVGFLVIGVFVVVFALKLNGGIGAKFLTGTNVVTEKKASPSIIPSSTPFTFQEITIPYLRNRQYQSSLNKLEKISENQSYASYLTSYTSDGLKINGLLTVPKGEVLDGWPAIVFVHGYIPPKSYQTTQNYADYVDFLARNGFVVFKIDLRGHGNSEGQPGGVYYSEDYIIDTLNAYTALQNTELVDPKKVGLWGHSMAGNVVLRSMAVKPEIPAVSIWAGAGFSYTDLNELGIQDNSYQPPQDSSDRQRRRQKLREAYGNPIDGHPFWKLVAPTSYLNEFKGAIQLNHAADDTVVDVEYSRKLNALLNQTSVPHEFNEYQVGGHNISGNTFNQSMQKTVEFFKKYL